jgi:hypothetical protein
MSVSSSVPRVIVVRAARRFSLCHGELSLHAPSILLCFPLQDSDSHLSIFGADAILVSICAAWCFDLHNCHPRLTSSRAKRNKMQGMAWPWWSLQFASRVMRNFNVSAQLEHQNFDSILLKTRGVEHCNAFWEKKE